MIFICWKKKDKRGNEDENRRDEVENNRQKVQKHQLIIDDGN